MSDLELRVMSRELWAFTIADWRLQIADLKLTSQKGLNSFKKRIFINLSTY